MAREIAIWIYLTVFHFFFNLFKRYPLRNKTTFIISFDDNAQPVIDMLHHSVKRHEIIILKDPRCKNSLPSKIHTELHFHPKHLSQFIKSIYHLATSSHVFVDNYYGFLAVTKFRDQVKCVQLWHAAGAIKKFGLEDLTNGTRSKRALRRVKAVYNRFDYVVVGSNRMLEAFKRSFGLPENRFLRCGIPRTDFFYDQQRIEHATQKLQEHFPILKDKKMLLYAPTYRDGKLQSTEIQLDLDKMYQQYKDDYVLFLRLHPAISSEFENKYPSFIYNVSGYPHINHLLVGADVLTTDYSSIPFEFSLLNKPMIFFAYDYGEYGQSRGVWEDYVEQVPGTVVRSTKELIDAMKTGNYQLERVLPFAREWNHYTDGHSSERLIEALYR